MVKSTNAAIIRISEYKLHDFVLEHKIQIGDYNNLWCGRNRHGEVVVCCIRNDLNYNINVIFVFFSRGIERAFFEILLPNSKPVIVETI